MAYTRLFDWHTSRPVEIVLAMISLGWAIHASYWGTGLALIMPIKIFTIPIAIASVFLGVGLVCNDFFLRKIGIAVLSVLWVSIVTTTLVATGVNWVYLSYAIVAMWAYITFVRLNGV